MLFGITIEELVAAFGVLGIAAIIFAESGLLIGFFLPGDTLLFTAGFLTQQDVITMNVNVLVLVLFAAAVAGDSVGYTFGRRIGRRIFRKKESLFFHQDNLVRAERFYEKYGPITIVLARFLPLVRTFAPIVAGVGKMRYQRFLAYNLLDGLLWAGGVTYLGYFGGAFLEARGIEVDHLILPVIALAMGLTVISPLYHIIKEPKSRELLLTKIGLRRKPIQKEPEQE